MKCSDCRLWLTMRVTDYEDGSRIIGLQSAEGHGQCQSLNIDTVADFGCNRFEEGHDHIEVMATKPGSPWHHSHYDTCPDCNGTGLINDSGCRRCARTGRVLFYDDGYIGEEQTRRHPNEIQKGPPPKPKCDGCTQEIDPNWVACPYCGYRLDAEKSIRVSEVL